MPKKTKKAKAEKKKSKEQPKRMLRGDPIISAPSAWWTILGLIEDEGWYQIHQAASEKEAARQLAVVFDSDSEVYDKFDDFAKLAPEKEHSIPAHVKGSERTYLESTSPATKTKRMTAAREHIAARGRSRSKKGKAA